jgi:hypothetical protein
MLGSVHSAQFRITSWQVSRNNASPNSRFQGGGYVDIAVCDLGVRGEVGLNTFQRSVPEKGFN